MGRRIAEARRAAGLSQEDLADRANVRAPTISRYERGQFSPRADKLGPIADALGTSIDWLFRGAAPADRGAIKTALQEFLDSPDGEDVDDDERAQLTSFQPSSDSEPTVAFYGALLLLIRSGMKRSLENRPVSSPDTSEVRETRKAASMRIRKAE